MRSDRFIFINGPPRVGKDTSYCEIEHLYRDDYQVVLERFSFPLKYAVLALLNVFSFDHPLAEELEANKEKPHTLLRGRTFRQAQIEMSERHVKPFYGKDQFGQWMVHRCIEHQRWRGISRGPSVPLLFVAPDSGFDTEAAPVVKFFTPERCLLIKLRRDGVDFTNDSRGYIDLENVTTYTVENNGTTKELRKELKRVIDKWISSTET